MQTVKYRYIRRNLNVGGRGNDVEQALNKFAGFGYKVISAVPRSNQEVEDQIYFVLERPLTDKEQRAEEEKVAEQEQEQADSNS